MCEPLVWSCAELPCNNQTVALLASVVENPGAFYCRIDNPTGIASVAKRLTFSVSRRNVKNSVNKIPINVQFEELLNDFYLNLLVHVNVEEALPVCVCPDHQRLKELGAQLKQHCEADTSPFEPKVGEPCCALFTGESICCLLIIIIGAVLSYKKVHI